MIIRSLEADYQVLYRKKETEAFELLICRNQKETADTTYTLLHFSQKEEMRRLVEKNLIEKEITGNFVDFKESFLWKEGLVMAFYRRAGMPIHTWLTKEQVSLSVRLEVGKRLLERLLLLNMPEYLLCGVLNEDCVLVTEAMEITINYEPGELIWKESEFPKRIRNGFYQIFSLLFQKEEQEQSCPEIHEYMEQLRLEPYQDIFHLYQTYDRMQELLMKREDVDDLKPRTWLYRLQALAATLLQIGQKLMVPVIIMIGMILMIYLICNPAQEEIEDRSIEQIGTLHIR